MRRAIVFAGISTALVAASVLACGEGGGIPETPNEDPGGSEAHARTDQQIINDFRQLWGTRREVFKNKFLGISTLQNPLDAWIIQEIISEVRPDFVIEAGTYHGGSAVLWALLLEQVNPDGRVITIDIRDLREKAAIDHPITHRLVDFLQGSSVAPRIVNEVKRRVEGKRVLVILDSLHTKEHVLAELEAYSPLVGVGSYIIVQDTLVGPILAIEEFLEGNTSFQVDGRRERFMVTNTDSGYLRRVR